MKYKNWKLVNEHGEEVIVGDTITDFRGGKATLTGGQPPLHQASTGRVYVKTSEYFPDVYDLRWVWTGGGQ